MVEALHSCIVSPLLHGSAKIDLIIILRAVKTSVFIVTRCSEGSMDYLVATKIWLHFWRQLFHLSPHAAANHGCWWLSDANMHGCSFTGGCGNT